MNIKMNKKEVNVVVEKEKPAIRLYGSNRSQHRPMSEEYDISYSELKEMEINDSIWMIMILLKNSLMWELIQEMLSLATDTSR